MFNCLLSVFINDQFPDFLFLCYFLLVWSCMKRMDSFCSETFLEAEMHVDLLSSVPEDVSLGDFHVPSTFYNCDPNM